MEKCAIFSEMKILANYHEKLCMENVVLIIRYFPPNEWGKIEEYIWNIKDNIFYFYNKLTYRILKQTDETISFSLKIMCI